MMVGFPSLTETPTAGAAKNPLPGFAENPPKPRLRQLYWGFD